MPITINPAHRYFPIFIFIAGALAPLAFAPVDQVWLIFPLYAVLLYALLDAGPKRAFVIAWSFALGLECAGISWIYFSLHFHGGSPPFLAILMVFLLACYLALYPALAAYLVNRFCANTTAVVKLLLLYPLALAVFEWLQGIVMTGFAWMQPGYTQIDTPLSGFAPLIGNYGVGVFVVMTAGVVVVLVNEKLRRQFIWQKSVFVLLAIWASGHALQKVDWTEPAGDVINVSIIQGNIPQDIKWRRDQYYRTLDLYQQLTLQQREKADLIIWPETAIPGYVHRVYDYLADLSAALEKTDTDLVLGIFIKEQDSGRYYNSMINVHGGEYRKRHLVPLGEYIPLRFLAEFFNRWIKIPMSDIDTGDMEQPLLTGAGQPLGISICFEDAFARDVRRDLPEATVLINVSNDAWFDGSHEPYQHHAIARMRAVETGRFMLRATNTGVSSVIGPKGDEIAVAPRYKTTVLNTTARPMRGSTPYVFWGDVPLLLVGALIFVFVCCFKPSALSRQPSA